MDSTRKKFQKSVDLHVIVFFNIRVFFNSHSATEKTTAV